MNILIFCEAAVVAASQRVLGLLIFMFFEEAERMFVSRVPVEKGWSGNRKFCVTDENGTKFLLRVASPETLKAKQLEFEMMKRLEALGVPMCCAVEVGQCDEGVYSLQTWIEGRDAEDVIPSLPLEAQYRRGVESGLALKKIHSIPAPEDQTPWAERFNRKIDRKIRMYEECPLKYENGGGEAFIRYLAGNRHLLDGRPQTFQHGDYHIGNMMIGGDGVLYIIDFNRIDFGDPWEEFNRIVWCAQKSPAFASGMLDGYFGGEIPEKFWRLLALYISSNTLSSLPWAIPFGQKEIDMMRGQAEEILCWYDNMKKIVPSWYFCPVPGAKTVL